jgi:hypothetical protein
MNIAHTNGHNKTPGPFNPALSGLQELLQRRPAVTPEPIDMSTPTTAPTPLRPRSRDNAAKVRGIALEMNRSPQTVRAMLKVLASDNGRVIGRMLTGRLSVARAILLIG